MAAIKKPEKAVRLARAIASDIAMYNEDRVEEAIMNDSFFEDLSDEITEGRELYESRVASELIRSTNFYDRALVDIILVPKAHLNTNIW